MSFKLSKAVNLPCVFLVQWKQLRGRLDAEYNRALLGTQIESIYPSYKVRELFKSRTGGTPSKSNLGYWQGNIPWASPKDFGPFYLVDTEDHISEAAVADSATAVVPAGSLLIVFRSGVLQHSLPVAVTTCDTAINQDLKALLPSGSASAEYLGAYFVIFGKRLLPLITKSGATVQSINTAQFDELGIPVPSTNIQKQVVRRLVSAFKRQADSERQAFQLLATIDDVLLEELGIPRQPEPPNTLESRIFKTEFGKLTGQRWDPLYHQADVFHFVRGAKCELKNLESVAEYFLTGFPAGRGDQVDEEDGGVIQIRPTNLNDDRELIFRRNVYIATEKLNTRKADVLKRREVLFNNTNSQEQVGKTVWFDLDGDFFSSNHITRIGTKSDELNPRYLAAVLNLYQRRKVFFKLCTNWNNQSGVGTDILQRIPVPVPKPALQEAIVDRIEAIRAQAQNLREQARTDLEQAKHDIEALILGKP